MRSMDITADSNSRNQATPDKSSVSEIAEVPNRRCEELQNGGDSQNELINLTGGVDSEMGEPADGPNDTEELPPTSVEPKSRIYLEARRHNSTYCQLRIEGQVVTDHAYSSTKNSRKGSVRTLKFDQDLGDPRRKNIGVVWFHVLHPEDVHLKHQDYIISDTKNDFKQYPEWNESLAKHNEAQWDEFMRRLAKIVVDAGGAWGVRKP
ncbi:hypothetical protein EJ07DRAFT_150351 [Lizonia empirigonia]|nr:hypothetical protein EJ07DRAFT_150351 [Lizonia empirigonia]